MSECGEGRYRFLEHTADAKLVGYGETLEEAFEGAALGTASVSYNTSAIGRGETEEVSLTAPDLQRLLCLFLEEVVFLFETRSFMLSRVEGLSIEEGAGGFSLRGDLVGDVGRRDVEVHGGVKAVTYDEMEIGMREGRHFVQVVLDV